MLNKRAKQWRVIYTRLGEIELKSTKTVHRMRENTFLYKHENGYGKLEPEFFITRQLFYFIILFIFHKIIHVFDKS